METLEINYISFGLVAIFHTDSIESGNVKKKKSLSQLDVDVGEQIHTFNKTLPRALMIKANRYARALKACEEHSSVQDSSSQAAKSH